MVGCGGIAHAHIRGYRDIAAELGEVVAGCDPDQDRLDAYCDEHDLPAQVSMEQWMGCGVGACLGCVVPAAAGDQEYVRVCTEGPVFDATEIAWDRMGL